MIEFCRVGVAMGNACDLLKVKANIICKSVVDDGLEDILKILFSD
jgi:hydroxymethylpyrimidine pyrophosphatase-like HAD family hydrolase